MPVRIIRSLQQRAWLGVLLVALPSTPVLAQDRLLMRPATADVVGTGGARLSIRVAPFRPQLGLAPDARGFERDVAWPQRRSVTREALAGGRTPTAVAIVQGDASTVTCPMPVARLDSSAVPAMPRLESLSRDPGGVVVPSCLNPLDVR